MDVVAAAVTGWFLVLGSGGYTSPVSIPVPYESQGKCIRAGKIAQKDVEGERSPASIFTCVPTNPDEVKLEE